MNCSNWELILIIINSKDGSSALSYAIMRLKEYGFEAYLDIYNREAKRLVHDPEEIETEKKAFVQKNNRYL